jgi:hypothetical protein
MAGASRIKALHKAERATQREAKGLGEGAGIFSTLVMCTLAWLPGDGAIAELDFSGWALDEDARREPYRARGCGFVA